MMKTTFIEKEIPDALKLTVNIADELRCPHMVKIRKGDQFIIKKCNRLLCKGGASKDPQEFKCPNCGNLTIFQKV